MPTSESWRLSFQRRALAFSSPIHPLLSSQFNFPQVLCWQQHPCFKSLQRLSTKPCSWPNSQALTGGLSPSSVPSCPLPISHRANTSSSMPGVHSPSRLMLYFWPQYFLIWRPLFFRLCISTIYPAYSSRSNSMSLVPQSRLASLHSKLISSFLDIPTAISLYNSDSTVVFYIL